MNKIDELKAKLHNTSLYTIGHDFDSTQREGGLYDVLEGLRPHLLTEVNEKKIELGEYFYRVYKNDPHMSYPQQDLFLKIKELENEK
jgi:hypothetical protein